MATSNPAIPGGLAGLGKLKELRQRLFFLLIALFIFRVCSFIPVPGINPGALAAMFETAFKVRSALNQDVWYTDVVSQEAGTSDGYFKTNVVAQFHYDTDE